MDKSINNLAMHLTNVAIQKTAANYDKETGLSYTSSLISLRPHAPVAEVA
jgi:hypothetical protein